MEGCKIRAYIDVYDEIYIKARKYIKDNSQYNPKVLKNSPQTFNSFPLIIITETENNLVSGSETLKYGEGKYNLTYEIELYAKDIDEKSKKEILDELKKLVNDIFDEYYKFTRKTCKTAPNADIDIGKIFMRYTAVIDENKKIYRR